MTSVLRALQRLNLHLHPNLHPHTRTHNTCTHTHTYPYTHTHTYTRKPRHVSSMLALVKCMIMLLVACWGFVSQLLPPRLTSTELGPPYALLTGLHLTSFDSLEIQFQLFCFYCNTWKLTLSLRGTSVPQSLPSPQSSPHSTHTSCAYVR